MLGVELPDFAILRAHRPSRERRDYGPTPLGTGADRPRSRPGAVADPHHGGSLSTVFATVRITERQRQWTLEALVQFWLAVILRAPRALNQALYEILEGSEPLFRHVQASPEAFFQRCQTLRPAFFAAVLCSPSSPTGSCGPPRRGTPWTWLRSRPCSPRSASSMAPGSRPSPTEGLNKPEKDDRRSGDLALSTGRPMFSPARGRGKRIPLAQRSQSAGQARRHPGSCSGPPVGAAPRTSHSPTARDPGW